MNIRTFASRAYPYVLAVPLAATPFFPRSLSASVVTAFALALAGVLCLLAAMVQQTRITRAAVQVWGAWTLLAGWFVIAALWASTPITSLLLPHGAASYVMVAAWLAAGSFLADTRTLRATLMTVTAIGTAFTIAAVYEALTAGAQRTQGYAAGFFENSASASEVFAVALVASITGAIISRDLKTRVAYSVAASITLGGVLLTSSRTALLGIALASAFAALVALVPLRRVGLKTLAAVPITLALALTALGTAASAGWLGPGLRQALSVVGTDRDAIWRSAWAQFLQSPLVGKGAAQFTAVIEWAGLARGQLTFNATADPHNFVLSALVGGGVIGLVLLVVAFGLLLHAVVGQARAKHRSFGVAALASLPVLLMGMGLVGWLSEAALLPWSSLLGALLGTLSVGDGSELTPASQSVFRWTGVALGAVALALTFMFVRPLAISYEYARATSTERVSLTPERAALLYEQFPLPAIATYSLTALAPQIEAGSPEARELATDVIRSAEKDSARSVPLALRSMATASVLAGANQEGFPLIEKQARAGATADPASGIWYAFAAVQAQRLGLEAKAREYATRALAYPQEDAMRVVLQSISEG